MKPEYIYDPYNLQDLKGRVITLIDQGVSFTVKLVVDKNNLPEHWIVIQED